MLPNVSLALAAVALLLQGLTTDAHVTGHPESERASSLIFHSFPVDPRGRVTEVAVIRSARYTVDQPQFTAFVDGPVARRGRGVFGKLSGASDIIS